MNTLAEEKLRAREQWSQDPCGAVHGRQHELGTREFFDSVERHRYTEYAPWMPRLMEFEKFRGKRLLEIGCGMGTDLLQFAWRRAMHRHRSDAAIGADYAPPVQAVRRRRNVYDF